MIIPDVDHRNPERKARDEQIARELQLASLDLPADTISALAGTWIQCTEGVCGGSARIRNTRYTIQGLLEWQQLGLSDAEILIRHPDLTQADLNSARTYYERTQEEIEEAIRANQEAQAILARSYAQPCDASEWMLTSIKDNTVILALAGGRRSLGGAPCPGGW